MAHFTLHSQLASDTHPVCELGLSRLLLMNDTSFPWLIMVPRVPDIEEIHDLTPGDQQALIAETTMVSRAFKRLTNADKMNVAALGNMVPQLHIHVIARYKHDAAWPGPIWGKVPAVPYGESEAAQWIGRIKEALQ